MLVTVRDRWFLPPPWHRPWMMSLLAETMDWINVLALSSKAGVSRLSRYHESSVKMVRARQDGGSPVTSYEPVALCFLWMSRLTGSRGRRCFAPKIVSQGFGEMMVLVGLF